MTTVVQPTAAAAGRARWAWMDNLRVAVIAGVIVVHVGIVYAVDFGWFYEERTAHPLTKAVLSMAFAPGFLFGMAVLFFVAGMGSCRSLERKGGRRFLRDRLVRLGLPLLAIVIVMKPVLELLGSKAEGDPAADGEWGFLLDELTRPGTAHGWFIAALLAFSVVHVAWRSRHPAKAAAGPLDRRLVITAWSAIAVGSFAVRLAWPVGEANPLELNLWEWPQMGTLYALGVLATERRWLDPMPDRLRRAAARGAAAGVGSAVVLAGLVFMSSNGEVYVGGADPRAIALPAVEATIAIGMSLWLMSWFPRRWNHDGPVARALGQASFAAYVIHLPILVWLSVVLRDVDVPAEAKFVFVSVVGVAASFSLAWIVVARGRR